MIKKLFSVIASLAMILGMTFTANIVHAEEVVYPQATDNMPTPSTIIKPGETLNLDEYIRPYVTPDNATIDENTTLYAIAVNDDGAIELDGRSVKGIKEGFSKITVTFNNEDDSTSYNFRHFITIRISVVNEVTSFEFRKKIQDVSYDPTTGIQSGDDVIIKTEPECAWYGISDKDIEYSSSDPTIAKFVGSNDYGATPRQLYVLKAGDVTITAKYKDFTTTAFVHIYEDKSKTDSTYQKYNYYASDSKTELTEYNKVLGYANTDEEYTVSVGDFAGIDLHMKWAEECSGTYIIPDDSIDIEGDTDCFRNSIGYYNVRIYPNKAGTETFTITRFGITKKVTIHCIDKGIPVIKEETKVNVDESVSKEDAEKIEETLTNAKVNNVSDTITDDAKNELIAGIDTDGKVIEISVSNTVNVTAADLGSDKKSITFEISPEVTVKVDGKVVKTAELKNSQLSGKKNIEITLPLNGLDIKEIVHKSEGYDPEYIYDFTVNDDDTVTFKVSHFSSFTLNEEVTKPAVKPDTKVDTTNESKTNAKGSPNTGDHSNVAVYGCISLFALIGFAGIIFFRRKHG